MDQFGELECSVVVEVVNSSGFMIKRCTHRHTCVWLGRDQFRDIYIKVGEEKLLMRDVKIHGRFAKEGKATIQILPLQKNVLLSNCPPEKLSAFLRLLSVKLGINKAFATGRMKLFSGKHNVFDEISPLTVQDLKAYKGQQVPLTASPVERTTRCDKNLLSVTPLHSRRPAPRGIEESSCSRKRLKVEIDGGNVLIDKDNAVQFTDASKKVKLTPGMTKEQVEILNYIKEGTNIFFTGSAGTGKSFLIKRIIGALPPDSTVASASTGVAACQIGGITLHSFAGIGSGDAPVEKCIELASRPSVAGNWRKCKTLIIDEISMVDAGLFDKLEEVARVIRKNDLPFGGIQLVLCGDFLQLPPVSRNEGEKKFCFQARTWYSCVSASFELTDVKRQQDKVFIDLLQYIRVGKCPDFVYQRLLSTREQVVDKNGVIATQLCTHKDSVDQINISKLAELKGDIKTFLASDSDSEFSKAMDKWLPVPLVLDLKVGAQVMLTKNIDLQQGLVNGARGVIISFQSDKTGLPLIRFTSGLELIVKQEKFVAKTASGSLTRMQLPLQLAWAISIHKSQGLTLDCCEVSLSRVFEYGQAYVALSRAKSLQGLRVRDINRDSVKAHPEVLKFYIKLRRDMRKNPP